jgi:hypothetical protein
LFLPKLDGGRASQACRNLRTNRVEPGATYAERKQLAQSKVSRRFGPCLPAGSAPAVQDVACIDRAPLDQVSPRVRRIMRIRSMVTLCVFGRSLDLECVVAA